MTTYSEFERIQMNAIKAKEEADLECISCKRCGSQWLMQIEAHRFQANHNLVPGQDIPPRPASVGYKFLQCLVCQNLIQPSVQHYVRDLAASDYDFCLDTLEGKFDEREGEKKEAKGEIKSQKL